MRSMIDIHKWMFYLKMLLSKITLAVLTIFSIFIIFSLNQNNVYYETLSDENTVVVSVPTHNKTSNYLDLASTGENTKQILRLFLNDLIFDVKPVYDNGKLTHITMDA